MRVTHDESLTSRQRWKKAEWWDSTESPPSGNWTKLYHRTYTCLCEVTPHNIGRMCCCGYKKLPPEPVRPLRSNTPTFTSTKGVVRQLYYPTHNRYLLMAYLKDDLLTENVLQRLIKHATTTTEGDLSPTHPSRMEYKYQTRQVKPLQPSFTEHTSWVAHAHQIRIHKQHGESKVPAYHELLRCILAFVND